MQKKIKKKILYHVFTVVQKSGNNYHKEHVREYFKRVHKGQTVLGTVPTVMYFAG